MSTPRLVSVFWVLALTRPMPSKSVKFVAVKPTTPLPVQPPKSVGNRRGRGLTQAGRDVEDLTGCEGASLLVGAVVALLEDLGEVVERAPEQRG